MSDEKAPFWENATLRLIAVLLLGLSAGGGTATAITTGGGLTATQQLEIGQLLDSHTRTPHPDAVSRSELEEVRDDLRQLLVITRRICRETIEDDPTVCDRL